MTTSDKKRKNMNVAEYILQTEQKSLIYNASMTLKREYTISTLGLIALFAIPVAPSISVWHTVYDILEPSIGGLLALVAGFGAFLTLESIGILASKTTIHLNRMYNKNRDPEKVFWENKYFFHVVAGVIIVISYVIIGIATIALLEGTSTNAKIVFSGMFLLALLGYWTLSLLEEVRAYQVDVISEVQRDYHEYNHRDMEAQVRQAEAAKRLKELAYEEALAEDMVKARLDAEKERLALENKMVMDREVARLDRLRIKAEKKNDTSQPLTESKAPDTPKVPYAEIRSFVEGMDDFSVNAVAKNFGLSWATANSYIKHAMNGDHPRPPKTD